jgi:hypothetical protein
MRTTRATRAALTLLAAGLIVGCSNDPDSEAAAPSAEKTASPSRSASSADPSAVPSPTPTGFAIEAGGPAEEVFGRAQIEQAIRFVNETLLPRTLANATLADPEPDSAEEMVAAVDDLLTTRALDHLTEAARVYPEGDPNSAATLLYIASSGENAVPKEPYVRRQEARDWEVDVDEEGRLAVYLLVETDYLAEVSGATEVQRQARSIGYYLLPQPEGAEHPWLVDGWGADIAELETVK